LSTAFLLTNLAKQILYYSSKCTHLHTSFMQMIHSSVKQYDEREYRTHIFTSEERFNGVVAVVEEVS